jgi:uncharacterized membrane protein
MDMNIPTQIPTILKIMVAVVSIITIILMGILVIKIYRDEARNEDTKPRNKGW